MQHTYKWHDEYFCEYLWSEFMWDCQNGVGKERKEERHNQEIQVIC